MMVISLVVLLGGVAKAFLRQVVKSGGWGQDRGHPEDRRFEGSRQGRVALLQGCGWCGTSGYLCPCAAKRPRSCLGGTSSLDLESRVCATSVGEYTTLPMSMFQDGRLLRAVDRSRHGPDGRDGSHGVLVASLLFFARWRVCNAGVRSISAVGFVSRRAEDGAQPSLSWGGKSAVAVGLLVGGRQEEMYVSDRASHVAGTRTAHEADGMQ